MPRRNEAPLILDDEATWPSSIVSVLERHRDVLLGWEQRRAGLAISYHTSAHEFDAAIYAIRDALSGHAIRGYHCTRLTNAEIDQIIAAGMTLQNSATLSKRIDALVVTGVISESIATRLKADNQADDDNRAGMLWFCFYPPHKAEQDGIERFFRSWGGEALYNYHESDETTGPVLGGIGIPCLVEADVTLDKEENASLAFTLARIFLVNRGLETTECVEHEGYATSPISPQNIRRIIRYPSDDFMGLTHAQNWDPPLTGQANV